MTRGASSAVLLAVAAVVAVVATVAGCGSAIDDRHAKWSFISATITEPNCATVGCHSAVAQQGGVDLSARDIGYKVLLERHFVLPGNPNLSSVIALMHAQGSIRMPPDLPLPEVDISLIGKWIADGAPND
jgi:hypothetical protein